METTHVRNPNAPFSAYEYQKWKEPYLFVSYAHADSAQVFPYIKKLHGDGFRIWYDEGIPFSSEWDEEIAAALEGAAMMVLFISPISVQRPNVLKELRFAIANKKSIMPMYLKETILPPVWQFHLGTPQAVLDINASYGKVKGDLPQSTRRLVPSVPVPSTPAKPTPEPVPAPLPVEPKPESAVKATVFPKIPCLKVGDPYTFGPYQWRVLEVQDSKALLITEDIIYIEKFYLLQDWLNNGFLSGFPLWMTRRNKAIIRAAIDGEIFLLSADEARKYFGSNDDRVAKYKGEERWWWLRSPGVSEHYATTVNIDGIVNIRGNRVVNGGGGVRPALWLNLQFNIEAYRLI